MARKKRSAKAVPTVEFDPPIDPPAPVPTPSDNPGACCPDCGCRHAPVQFTQRSGRRTIRTRECRNCGTRFREIATAERLR